MEHSFWTPYSWTLRQEPVTRHIYRASDRDLWHCEVLEAICALKQ